MQPVILKDVTNFDPKLLEWRNIGRSPKYNGCDFFIRTGTVQLAGITANSVSIFIERHSDIKKLISAIDCASSSATSIASAFTISNGQLLLETVYPTPKMDLKIYNYDGSLGGLSDVSNDSSVECLLRAIGIKSNRIQWQILQIKIKEDNIDSIKLENCLLEDNDNEQV